MVCIIGITAALVLNKCEPASSVNHIRRYFKVDLGRLTGGFGQYEELECRNGQDGHSYITPCQSPSVRILRVRNDRKSKSAEHDCEKPDPPLYGARRRQCTRTMAESLCDGSIERRSRRYEAQAEDGCDSEVSTEKDEDICGGGR